MFVCSSASDFLSSEYWKLYSPPSALTRCTFYHLSQLFPRTRLASTRLLSGKAAGNQGAGWDGISLAYFALLLWQIRACSAEGPMCRTRPSLKIHVGTTEIQYVGWRQLHWYRGFWGGLFLVLSWYPSALLLSVSRCEVLSSPGRATAGCSPCLRLSWTWWALQADGS